MSVRIGFIGTGGIAVSHLTTLVTLPDAEVVALCDLSTERVEMTRTVVRTRIAEQAEAGGASGGSPAHEHGSRIDGAAAYDDYRQMLRNEDLDAVYLCLPPFAHGDPEDAVIEAGLPMLVEKPVALDLPLAARLLTEIRRRDLLVATGYQTRYATFVRRARDLIAGRTVGMALVTRFGSTPRTGWYHRQDRSGGQLTEMATHQVDLLRHLVDEIDTVYAAAGTRINQRNQPDYDIFDVNCMTMTFANGAVANFAVNFVAESGTPLHGAGLHLYCDELSLTIDGQLRAFTPNGAEQVPSDAPPMALQDAAFVRAVGEGRRDLVRSDYENGVRNLAVTLANDRSARSGQPVDVGKLLADEAPAVGPPAHRG